MAGRGGRGAALLQVRKKRRCPVFVVLVLCTRPGSVQTALDLSVVRDLCITRHETPVAGYMTDSCQLT